MEDKMEDNSRSSVVANVLMIMISVIIFVFGICLFSGCTYSITMVHTEGSASDVVDETATNTPSTSVSVPVSVVPK